MHEASARKDNARRASEPYVAPRPRTDLRLVDPNRRTVIITGRPDPEPRRRPSRARTQTAARPDRVAAWAVGLGFFLVLMAAVAPH
jgi:hypothetical protein